MDGVRWAFRCGKWRPTPEQWTLAAQCIQPEEKQRIGKFVFQKDAKPAMCGRLLLRKVIGESLSIPYREIQLSRTEKGKPFLENHSQHFPNFNFNVSHQGEYAMLAAESEYQVGVDVMQIEYPRNRGTQKFFSTFERQFTAREWSAIRGPTSEWQQLTNFYRFWCLKESYVKALGIGIGFTLHRLEFHVNSEVPVGRTVCDTKVYVDGSLQQDWRFEETMLDDKHGVSVALKKKDSGQKWSPSTHPFKQLDFEELLSGAEPQTPADPAYWDSFTAKSERPGNR